MKIHPLTYLYLLLAFISGSSYYVAFLFFSILHEIGHYLVALYFSIEIEKIMILPFGAFLSLKDLGKHYVYEEIGMLLCGPFINLICFIFFLFIKEPLLAKINIYILIFNLLPVYPLDGSKLLLLFLSYFIDYQKAMQIQIKVSLLFICILWIITKQIGRKIILGYLFYQVILYLKNYRLIYMETLMSDHLSKKRVKINKHLEYFRPYKNIYHFHQRFYDFDTIKIYLIKSKKSH